MGFQLSICILPQHDANSGAFIAKRPQERIGSLTPLFGAIDQMYYRRNALRTEYGTQPMPVRLWGALLEGGRLAIPTKTPLAVSQLFGRLGSSLRVPPQVLKTSLPG